MMACILRWTLQILPEAANYIYLFAAMNMNDIILW